MTMYGESDGPVRVAAGVIRDGERILICQRGMNHRYGLKWEFPGGKTYPGESLSECLIRELEEELDIIPKKFRELKTLQTTYPDGGKFQVTFFLVTSYDGTLQNNVFEKIQWASLSEIGAYDMLEGSLPILQLLQDRLL